MLADTFARRLRLRGRDLFAATAFELRADVVVDPLRVPPFDRQHGDAVEIDAEVQVVARRETRLAALAHDLARLDLVADLDVDLAKVPIEREEAEAVIED